MDTSLDLVHLEQKRVLGMFSSYLEAARTRQNADGARQSVRELNSRIDEFLAELGLRHPSRSIERRNAVLSRQKLITWLERAVLQPERQVVGDSARAALWRFSQRVG